jgi:hypothetical protein
LDIGYNGGILIFVGLGKINEKGLIAPPDTWYNPDSSIV